jgi:hypothetical protein
VRETRPNLSPLALDVWRLALCFSCTPVVQLQKQSAVISKQNKNPTQEVISSSQQKEFTQRSNQ